MTKADQYVQSQLPQILQPGEQVLHVAYMRRQPGLAMQILLVGGLLLFLITKAYFAVLTNRRLILIRTKMSFLTGGPKEMNLGVEQYDARAIQKVTVSGFANNRSMTFHLEGGKKETLRISPWFKQIAGTKAFFEQVPQLVTSGQLAQLAAAGGGAPQLGYAAPVQQGYGAPPPMAGVFPPGANVQVSTPDGYRYPATIVQAQNGHYLCAMPNGQQHWFPAAAISG